MTDTFDHGLIGAPVTAHIAGQNVKIIDKMPDKRCIRPRTKTVAVQKMRLHAITTPVQIVNTPFG